MKASLLIALLLFPSAAARAALDCAPFCGDLTTPVGKSRCYACRCKDALDGWLPSREEIQCASGKPIPIYRSKKDKPLELEEVLGEVASCHNPARFGGACSPGSRLGQLRHGDVMVKWICRHNTFTPKFADPLVAYDAVAVIAANVRTGATCFWNDDSGTIAGNDFPPLDLTHASAAETALHAQHFAVSEGAGCIYCHDNDPFLYTPFLAGAGWQSGEYTDGPYGRVLMRGDPAPIGYRMLTAKGAESCLSCHRIATGRSCMSWVKDAMGVEKDYGHEPAVLAAVDRLVVEGGVTVRKPGVNWSLAYWMPPRAFGARFDPHRAATWEGWHERYGRAKDIVLKCCAEAAAGGASPECTWGAIPGPIIPPH